jgi:hypothetical protein
MKKIKLTQGKFALVDDEDFEWLNQWKWCYHKEKNKNTGYVVRAINKKLIRMHRQILNLIFGDKKDADHKDHNGLNNQKNNLRIVTSQENRRNSLKIKNCFSKYKGVSLHKSTKKWRAYIVINYKQKHLGLFISEKKAAKVYNQAAIKYFGKHAYLNII